MRLEPLSYHRRMRDFLKSQHAELWEWFASTEATANYKAAVELQLLKTTYRMDRESHADLYQLVTRALAALEIDTPVTLYQAQDTAQISASIYYTPGHSHIVFGGGILKLLDPDERLALLGHELAHFKLWTTGGGDFLVADRLLQTLANEPRATHGHLESARLWQLYTEIYADRGGARATGDANAQVSALVKVTTGTDRADAASYIRQAGDIFAAENPKTGGITHPETFIRARAIHLWATTRPDDPDKPTDVDHEIHQMIEGHPSFDTLDLLAQDRLTNATRRLVRHHLAPAWLRTPPLLAHAAHFFDGDPGPRTVPLTELQSDWQNADEKTRDYACYLLLDFAWADPDLEEHGLAAAFATADHLGYADRLEELATRELKLKKSQTAKIRKNAPELIAEAENQAPGEDAT